MKNLWQVGGGDLTAPEDAAVYLVRLGKQAALIDAGCGYAHDRLIDNIAAVLPEEVQVRSLKFMMGLKADILCEGHFGIYKGVDNINKFIQSYL